ncbi:MAG TPA: hypothetical protein VGZ03_09110 [Acidimicrobiales bacterium]|nr:hypothetical protein [Acidimicrobiales bacterium]
MRKQLLFGTGTVLTIVAMSLASAGPAFADKGGHPGKGGHHSPVVATGTTTCNFHGTLSAAAGATVSIAGNLTPHKHTKACTSSGGTKLRTGHLSRSPLASTTTTAGICSLLTGGTLPDVAGGTIWWSPKPKVAASTGVALTGGSVSVVTISGDAFLQIAYTGGSVAGGSFTNASGGALTTTSRDDVAALTAACATGPVDSIAISGTITL